MAEITGKDPELHLENVREARMTAETHTADEHSTLVGVGKRHRTREAPTQTPLQDLEHTRTSFPFPKPAPTIASPAQGNHLPPWAPQQHGREPLGSSSSYVISGTWLPTHLFRSVLPSWILQLHLPPEISDTAPLHLTHCISSAIGSWVFSPSQFSYL